MLADRRELARWLPAKQPQDPIHQVRRIAATVGTTAGASLDVLFGCLKREP